MQASWASCAAAIAAATTVVTREAATAAIAVASGTADLAVVVSAKRLAKNRPPKRRNPTAPARTIAASSVAGTATAAGAEGGWVGATAVAAATRMATEGTQVLLPTAAPEGLLAMERQPAAHRASHTTRGFCPVTARSVVREAHGPRNGSRKVASWGSFTGLPVKLPVFSRRPMTVLLP